MVPLAAYPLLAQEDAHQGEELPADSARAIIRQWVETERLISEEKTSWEVEKKQMQSLLELYRKELTLLDEELQKAGGSAELVDQDKNKLEAELKQFRAAQRSLTDAMAKLLPRVRAIVSQFPDPLVDDIQVDVDVLNAPDALGKPRDVLRSMISVLTAAERFNRTVTLAEETRQVRDKKVSVDVLYLGLARAFYVAGSGDIAGVGTPGQNGWQWKDEAAIADDVRRAIAVYQKDEQPQLLKLPVALRKEERK